MAAQLLGSRLPVRDIRKFEEHWPRLIVLLLVLFSHMLVHGRVPTRFGFGIIIPTGVDLSKILGGKKVIKSDKCMGVSQLLEGMCLCWSPSPKSMPMVIPLEKGPTLDEGNGDIYRGITLSNADKMKYLGCFLVAVCMKCM